MKRWQGKTTRKYKLYQDSKSGKCFTNLMKHITSEENILLAYRSLKKNKGSKTKGTNESTIIQMGEKNPEELVSYVRNRLHCFHPHTVRRVEIPKPDGRMRPLGIPTIEDRIIQQCIKQVLEPICEAKFHKHSYGFRPNRSAHHAIARAMFLTNIGGHHYVVDIDIKGFFDNVDHGKLLKQLWTLGIRDKQLLCIISKMLKAPIAGIGVPERGVPQGGILRTCLHRPKCWMDEGFFRQTKAIRRRRTGGTSRRIDKVWRKKTRTDGVEYLRQVLNPLILQQLMEHPIQCKSAELNDNRISMYVAQRGKCAISKESLILGEIVVHHIRPRHSGGGTSMQILFL